MAIFFTLITNPMKCFTQYDDKVAAKCHHFQVKFDNYGLLGHVIYNFVYVFRVADIKYEVKTVIHDDCMHLSITNGYFRWKNTHFSISEPILS